VPNIITSVRLDRRHYTAFKFSLLPALERSREK